MFSTERIGSVFFSGTAAINSVKKNGGPASAVRSLLKSGSVFLRAVARLDVLFLRVLARVFFDLRAHELAVGLHPVADDLPFLSVPLLELHQARAFMVHARDLERRHKPERAEFLQPLLVDVQVLDAPAHLFAGDRLALAEARLGNADRLGGDDSRHHAAGVIDRSKARLVVELAL